MLDAAVSAFVLMPSSDCLEPKNFTRVSLLAKLLVNPILLGMTVAFLKPASMTGREVFFGRSFS